MEEKRVEEGDRPKVEERGDLFADGGEEDLFGSLVRPSFELDEEEDLFGGEEI